MRTQELKAYMVRREITTQMLADELNLSKTSLSYKINGKREFKVSEIIKVQNILGMSNEDRDFIFFEQGLKNIQLNSTEIIVEK